VLVSIVLSNKGFFANFQQAFMSTKATVPTSQQSSASTGEYSITPMLQTPLYPSLPTPSLTLSPYTYQSVDPLTLY
jgi:hypothetical protein